MTQTLWLFMYFHWVQHSNFLSLHHLNPSSLMFFPKRNNRRRIYLLHASNFFCEIIGRCFCFFFGYFCFGIFHYFYQVVVIFCTLSPGRFTVPLPVLSSQRINRLSTVPFLLWALNHQTPILKTSFESECIPLIIQLLLLDIN